MQAGDASGRINYHDFAYSYQNSEGKMDVIKGPWTSEEDAKLTDYINLHGEGHWNSLACLTGLKRTGKSCRLRWLNYLRPNLRRGKLTIEEQLSILELHSRFGNRWSRIAQHLPGRTDNEIKNYWRTRVQKLARLLNCHVNSDHFRYTLRSLLLPRLVEQFRASSGIHVQSSDCSGHNSYWTDPEVAAGQTELGPTFACHDSHQQYCSASSRVPPAWNDFWGSHDSNKCSLENFPPCPSELFCSPFLGATGFVELDNQAFVHTEPDFGSPDMFLNSENFWHSVEQSPESLMSS